MKVLIVDDNWQARSMIKRYLSDRDDVFFECEDGSEAVVAYTDCAPDWVLMDWEMKQVNGLDATERLLRLFPDAKVLIVTNHDDAALRQDASEAGACGFFLKDNLLGLRSFMADGREI